MKVAEPLTRTCGTAAPLSTLSEAFPAGVPEDELTVTVTVPAAP